MYITQLVIVVSPSTDNDAFRIRDILERIRILGSVPHKRIRIRILLFSSVIVKMQTKNFLFSSNFFLLITFLRYIYFILH
jgi:hypothetical protein